MLKRVKIWKYFEDFLGEVIKAEGGQSWFSSIVSNIEHLEYSNIRACMSFGWITSHDNGQVGKALPAWVTSPGPYPIPEYGEDGLTPNVPLTLFHHYITFPPTTILTTTLISDDDQMSYFLVLFLTGGPAAGGLLLTGGLSSPPPWLNAWARTTPTSPPSPWRPFSSWKYHHVIIWWM